ncbi:uncharacterized protein LOC128209542 [Mya arenaria]|uniref:uncharacterized protein LOC128209542 n=1 Tax=Mya arenaria TaxID=6604 RepID=UPI0022E035C3|nr:uncharacterized protein LOC128209542 [Mya arenaria]
MILKDPVKKGGLGAGKSVLLLHSRMILKDPVKKGGLGAGKAVMLMYAAANTVFLISCYHYFRKLNKSDEFRYKWYNEHPKLVQFYYMIDRHVGKRNTYYDDVTRWKMEGRTMRKDL